MKTLAKYHVCIRSVIGEKLEGKLPGLSRNRPQDLLNNSTTRPTIGGGGGGGGVKFSNCHCSGV